MAFASACKPKLTESGKDRYFSKMANLQVENIQNRLAAFPEFAKKRSSSNNLPAAFSLSTCIALDNFQLGGYKNSRSYAEINGILQDYLKFSIEKLLQHMCKKKGKSSILRILDDGCGAGRFLHEIKYLLKCNGIACETTGVSLSPLSSKYQASVGTTIICDGLFYVPAKKQDLIISYYGTAYFAPFGDYRLLKYYLLKTAYSLQAGGMAILVVDANAAIPPKGAKKISFISGSEPSSSTVSREPTYGKNRKNRHWFINKFGHISIADALRSFEKRGFGAQICDDFHDAKIVLIERFD